VVAAAQAKTGHPPAREDCGSCHQPHRSDQPRLLGDKAQALCAGCHDPSDAALKKAHLRADLGKLDCLTCHSPHGEGQKKLLARNVHPPVLDGCDSCHEGRFDKLASGGPPALCLTCHGDVGELAQKAKVPHAAMQMVGCNECHNPHASPQRRLVKSPGAGPCETCHADQVAGPGESAHEVIATFGCGACHEPHGGAQAKMLRQSGNALCLACHDARNHKADPKQPGVVRVMDRLDLTAAQAKALATLRLSADGQRDHPIPGHRAVGKPGPKELERRNIKFEGELGCLTCHDPHKGASRQLLRWGARSATDACAHCHQK
jgi:predicted CXXCH cytochrome family protein